MHEKILVAGAGAIGGITGGILSMNGYDVVLFDVNKEHVEKMNKDGLLIEGMDGKKRIKVKAVTRIRGKYDIVFLAVKSQYTEDALKRILPHLKEDGIIVSLQNSINEENIAQKVGVENTIGCVIGWSATNVGNAHLKFTSEGEFIIGKLDGKIDEKVEKVKKLLEKVAPVKITENIYGYLWTKLLINSAIASVGALYGDDLGKVVKDRKSVANLVSLADELVRMAEKMDIQLEEFEGLHPSFFKIDNYEDFKRGVAIVRMAGKKHARLRSTILQDLEKGRKTEIDYLNGYIEKKANEYGMETRINKKIIEVIKEIEKGKRKMGSKNVEEVFGMINIPKKWIDFKEKELEYSLYNLPYELKWKNSLLLAESFLNGTVYAFSQAFGRITDSFLGKIFIRKDSWEIVNITLTKFLEKLGENVGEVIKKNYNLQENEKDMLKAIATVFNNLGMKNEIMKNEIIAYDCFFLEGAKRLEIQNKLNFPLCYPFLEGMKKKFNVKFELVEKKCKGDEKCIIRASK